MGVNRFDEHYEIRLAKVNEIPEIMEFIDSYWKKGHILATDRDFFDYEMTMDKNQVNFIIAKTKQSRIIDGILGFLPCSLDTNNLDAWGVIWKTKDNALPMLGLELKKRYFKLTGARSDLGVGANLNTSVPLLSRIMHYYTAKMKHYYRLNNLENYSIAYVEHKDIPVYKKADVSIEFLETQDDLSRFFDFSSLKETYPLKDSWYYNKRFYNHPKYQYKVWGIRDSSGLAQAFFVTREQNYRNAKCISIVDFAGDQKLFSECGAFFDEMMEKEGQEYIDFYFDGFEEDYVKEAGFIELLPDDKNIIPCYFNPFVLSNVDIYVDASDKEKRYLFFKADGDQDRPN